MASNLETGQFLYDLRQQTLVPADIEDISSLSSAVRFQGCIDLKIEALVVSVLGMFICCVCVCVVLL